MNMELRISFAKSIVFVVYTIAVTSGCTNFDHPLPWSHSPLHEELPGSWHAVHESEPPMPIEVTMNEDGSLSVDMAVTDTDESPGSDSSESSGSEVHRVSFQGDVLAFNDVHVLQIDMRTYKEHSREEKEQDSSDRDGYRFLRIVSEEGSMVFQQIDIELFARYAAEELVVEGTTLTDAEFANCINQRIRSGIAIGVIADLLKERPSNWLSADELRELERELKEIENHTVDPYQQLQKMRECIVHKLPGELLGRLFISDPNVSFSGETIRVVKVK